MKMCAPVITINLTDNLKVALWQSTSDCSLHGVSAVLHKRLCQFNKGAVDSEEQKQ
jgi:hypothetical protein